MAIHSEQLEPIVRNLHARLEPFVRFPALDFSLPPDMTYRFTVYPSDLTVTVGLKLGSCWDVIGFEMDGRYTDEEITNRLFVATSSLERKHREQIKATAKKGEK